MAQIVFIARSTVPYSPTARVLVNMCFIKRVNNESCALFKMWVSDLFSIIWTINLN